MMWYEDKSNFPALCKIKSGEYTVIVSCDNYTRFYQAEDEGFWNVESITFIAPISDVMAHYPEHLI